MNDEGHPGNCDCCAGIGCDDSGSLCTLLQWAGLKTLYVGPYQVDCTGVAAQKCLRVKEKPEEQEWTLFADSIQGLAYEEGFDYELRMTKERVDDPTADAPAFRWTLVEQVGKAGRWKAPPGCSSPYLDPEGTMTSVLSGSQVTARFQEGQVGGNASCNSYFGTYQLDGGKMTLQMGGSTMMYCAPEAMMTQEQDYLAALGRADFYLVASDELRIADANGQTVLKFGVLQPKPLLGTNSGTGRLQPGQQCVRLGAAALKSQLCSVKMAA